MKKNSGNTLVVFVGALLVAMIFLPFVTQLLRTEAKRSDGHQRSTVAFQLAETAVAKGVAKLSESRKNWTDALSGVPIPRFRGWDSEAFTDVSGGNYKVAFSTVSGMPGIVYVTGKGRDNASREIRVIVAGYSHVDPDTPALILNQGLASALPDIEVNWGAVKSYGDCFYSLTRSFPRLYSAGLTTRDSNPALPNNNTVDNWSYQTDMGSPPFPDFGYYKGKAMNSVVPSSSTKGEIRRSDGSSVVRNPPNSGYFQSSLNVGKGIIFDKSSALGEGLGNHYEFRSSTSVLYFEINPADTVAVSIARAFLEVEAVIANAPYVDLNGSSTTFRVFGATIPLSAQTQYAGNKVWVAGYPTAAAVWVSTFVPVAGLPTRCCYNIPNVQIHGYFYSPRHSMGSAPLSRGGRVVGVLHAGGPTTGGGSFFSPSYVYFDPKKLNSVVWTNGPLYRVSWIESGRTW
jgi:hypothetical protein